MYCNFFYSPPLLLFDKHTTPQITTQTYLCGHKCGDTVVERLHVLWLDIGEVVLVRKHVDHTWVPTGTQNTAHALYDYAISGVQILHIYNINVQLLNVDYTSDLKKKILSKHIS